MRALVRAGREGGLPAGAEPVVGDLTDPAGFASALGGVDGAFLLSGYANEEATLRALRDAGARRVVLLSSGSVPGEPGNAVTAYHAASEAAVEASGLAWTFLRPNASWRTRCAGARSSRRATWSARRSPASRSR